MQYPCTGVRLVGCGLIAFSGLLLVGSLLAGEKAATMMAALALYSAGISPAPLMLSKERSILAVLALSLAAVAILAYSESMWPLSTALSVAAAGLAALDRWQASVPMIAAPAALAAALSPGDYRWLVLAAYTAALALAAALYFRKPHASALAAASLVPLVYPGLPAILAALAATLVYLAVTRTVEAALCPFKVDSRSLFAGSMLTAAGFAFWIAGAETLGYPLALAGTIILVASNLAPYTPGAAKKAL
jgi:hypothetical protein